MWKKSPCQMAGDDPAAVTPHGGPTRPETNQAKHTTSESNTAVPVLEARPVPDGGAKMAGVECNGNGGHHRSCSARGVPPEGIEPSPATFAASRPIQGRGQNRSSRWLESHQRQRGCHPRALLLSYIESSYHREELNLSRRVS